MMYRKKRNRFRSFYFALRFALKKVPWKGLIFVFLGVLLLFFFTQQWILAYASLDWRTTQGEVITSQSMACRRKYLPDDYQAIIKYEYSVNGILYSSNNITFAGDWSAMGCGNAEKVMKKYPLGKSVLVSYDPQNPENAVLQPGGTNFGGIGVSVALVIFGIMFVINHSSFAHAKRTKRILQNKALVK